MSKRRRRFSEKEKLVRLKEAEKNGLHQLFDLAKTGELIWKRPAAPQIKAGTVAGADTLAARY
jgi:hypothetical protein